MLHFVNVDVDVPSAEVASHHEYNQKKMAYPNVKR